MRRPVRTAATAVLLTLVLAACGNGGEGEPAILAETHGANQEAPISVFQAVLLFGVAPIAIAVLIGALAWLPGAVRSNRYRPARGWNAAPVWFSGPTDPAAAVQEAQPGELVRGGASGSW